MRYGRDYGMRPTSGRRGYGADYGQGGAGEWGGGAPRNFGGYYGGASFRDNRWGEFRRGYGPSGSRGRYDTTAGLYGGGDYLPAHHAGPYDRGFRGRRRG